MCLSPFGDVLPCSSQSRGDCSVEAFDLTIFVRIVSSGRYCFSAKLCASSC